MWPTLLLGLLVASLAGWGITAYLQTRRIRRLERSHEEIQVEETLVFDFLHGLGEAFRGTIRPQELHRLIVEGAVRILDAHGGALYVTDRIGGLLRYGIPEFKMEKRFLDRRLRKDVMPDRAGKLFACRAPIETLGEHDGRAVTEVEVELADAAAERQL